jgi:hypothetical protein
MMGDKRVEINSGDGSQLEIRMAKFESAVDGSGIWWLDFDSTFSTEDTCRKG